MLNPNYGTITEKSLRRRELLAERDGFMGCVYCGVASFPKFLVLEHVVPRSRGGPDGNYNRVLACHDCDVLKDNRTPQEWRPGVVFGNDIVDCPTTLRRYNPNVVEKPSPFEEIQFCHLCNSIYSLSSGHCDL